MEYAVHKLFRSGVRAVILAVSLCCALLFLQNTRSHILETHRSAVALTPAKVSATGASFGKYTQTADLAPVRAAITPPGPSTHCLTIARTPATLSTPVTFYSGRAPPPTA